MNYPIWEVPVLGGSWIIGIISCIHIFISHFAVGGGMFFAVSEWLAHKNNDHDMYAYLKKHALFFLLLTSVAGAVTGVAIWWTIGLVSPDGTGTLIQTYTFVWACEYIFFVAEIAIFFVYFYSWGRISRSTHLKLAIAYAISSVMSLVFINGILTFMLTPGQWHETAYWLDGFFNPTYWPSLIIRLMIMAAIAGMYALATSARLPQGEFRSRMIRYSTKWFIPVFAIGPLVGWWFANNLPPNVLGTISTGIQTSGIGNFSILARALYLSVILSGTIVIFSFVGPYLNPKGFSYKTALMFLVCGLLVTSISEWSREMLRKPYIVYEYLYSNGVHVNEVQHINEVGYLTHSKWSPKDTSPLSVGRHMFVGQCMVCHTTDGYRSMKKFIGDRNKKAIKGFLTTLHETDLSKNPYGRIMPPVVGTDDELNGLAAYLETLNHPERVNEIVLAK